jgi:flagellar biosynthetic protein FliR
MLAKEFIIGFILGTVVNIFFSLVNISGEVIDMQMGLSMSQMYDPASNTNMPLSGNFYYVTLILLFFVTNAHGNLLQIIILSFRIMPVDTFNFNPAIGMYLMEMFGEILLLSLKFALPVIAAELITETGVGIIMRAVPQINVFVVGLQLKILAGLVIMILCAPVSVWFFDHLLREMGERALEAIIFLTQ